jgi:hypothetical protein
MNDDIKEKLYHWLYCADPNVPWDLFQDVKKARSRIEELEHEVETLRKALDVYQRERDRFRHANPEITGEYFLTGGYGERDYNLLPEFVTVCPAYGAGWEQVYTKTERTVSYEGS